MAKLNRTCSASSFLWFFELSTNRAIEKSLEPGLLDDFELEILRCTQDDSLLRFVMTAFFILSS